MAHLTADVDGATAPGQLEGHEVAEAGGAQVLLQHGLSQALVLVQEAQVQGHAIHQVAPGTRVERAAGPVQLHWPGAPALHGLQLVSQGTMQQHGGAALPEAIPVMQL